MFIIKNTILLEEVLSNEQLKELKQNFKEWKFNGGKDDFYYFGKDGAYYYPKLSVGQLKHVHIEPSSVEELRKWKLKWKYENKANTSNESRKVSNRALVYAENRNTDFLLITILEDAHNVINDKEYMNLLGDIAEDFIIYDEISA